MSKWPHEMLTFPRVHGHENDMIWTWNYSCEFHRDFIQIRLLVIVTPAPEWLHEATWTFTYSIFYRRWASRHRPIEAIQVYNDNACSDTHCGDIGKGKSATLILSNWRTKQEEKNPEITTHVSPNCGLFLSFLFERFTLQCALRWYDWVPCNYFFQVRSN